MNHRRKLLTALVILLLAAGAGLSSIPLVESLNPTEKALEGFQRIDIADIADSNYRFIEYRTSHEERTDTGAIRLSLGAGWLVVRDSEGEFHVYELPTWERQILMPYKHWGQFEGVCADFGPNKADAKVSRNTLIQCNDENIEAYFAKHWFWRLDGDNVSGVLPDLRVVSFTQQSTDLVLHKR